QALDRNGDSSVFADVIDQAACSFAGAPVVAFIVIHVFIVIPKHGVLLGPILDCILRAAHWAWDILVVEVQVSVPVAVVGIMQ
ncbi:MAG: hypothetical protein K8F51_04390, partial [Comamonas sp.]|nr:hypothetical protein [Comamonas sp.]